MFYNYVIFVVVNKIKCKKKKKQALDVELSIEQHTSQMLSDLVFFYIKSLSKVHLYITYKAVGSIIDSLILSKLD